MEMLTTADMDKCEIHYLVVNIVWFTPGGPFMVILILLWLFLFY